MIDSPLPPPACSQKTVGLPFYPPAWLHGTCMDMTMRTCGVSERPHTWPPRSRPLRSALYSFRI
eukprot:325803-Chlamydomonas_euryale.AAC.13